MPKSKKPRRKYSPARHQVKKNTPRMDSIYLLFQPIYTAFDRLADGEIEVSRGNRTGKFGLTGDELKAIDEMLDLHRQAIGVLTQGMLTVAMIDAEGMVNAEIARAKEPTACT